METRERVAGKNHIVREYRGVRTPFQYVENGLIVCQIPADVKRVSFEFYLQFGRGKLYLINERGEHIRKAKEFSIETLAKIEEEYELALEAEKNQ